MNCFVFVLALALQAQQPAPQGVAPAWDTGRIFAEVSTQSSRLQPLLRQVKPRFWPGAGAAAAPDEANWEAALKENLNLPAASEAVAKNPERVGETLRLLLSVQKVDMLTHQLLEGIRNHQNPALAELIAGTLEEGRASREALEQRVLDLVTEREHQFEVADHEAQRCRELLSKQPNARGVKSK